MERRGLYYELVTAQQRKERTEGEYQLDGAHATEATGEIKRSVWDK